MNIQSAISREIFVPRDEKLLVAIEVRRRMKKKGLSFLNAGRKRDYLTYLYACSVNMVIYRCKIFLNRMKNSMTANQGRPQREAVKASRSRSRSSPSPPVVRKMGNVMRRASQVLSERGERLMRADDKTSHLMHGAKQFAEAAQKLALKQI
uniref:Syntaxin binding protein 6 (amisyn), like n=2 Tax=Cyprinus carpio TaxID=7962 RepID=A0A8C2DMK7_CYPCA